MKHTLRAALAGTIALAAIAVPAAAFAQMEMDPMMPMQAGPLTEQDAADIAMENGVAMIEEIERDGGVFEVDGRDGAGNDLDIDIDAMTGAVLKIDD